MQDHRGDERTNGSAFDGGRRLEIAEDVVSRRIGDDTVILRLQTEQYFGLDGVGSRLWKLLVEGTTVIDAIAVIAAEYDVDADVVRADIHGLLGDLAANDLVLLATEPESPR